jgi:chromosome segregation ATPase
VKEQLEAAKAKMAEEVGKLGEAKAEAVARLTSEIEALKVSVGERKAEADGLKGQLAERERVLSKQLEAAKADLGSKEEQLGKAGQELAVERTNVQRLNQGSILQNSISAE